MTLAWPLDPRARAHATRSLGAPRDGGARRHEGVDIIAARGTPVRSPVDGVVARVSARDEGNEGFAVSIRDRDGTRHLLAHLDAPPVVLVGERVAAGQLVGVVGSSGNARGPHLHYQATSDGVGTDRWSELVEAAARERANARLRSDAGIEYSPSRGRTGASSRIIEAPQSSTRDAPESASGLVAVAALAALAWLIFREKR